MKDIPGHEGRYAISEDGKKVLSYPKPKKMWQGGIGWTKKRFLTLCKRPRNYQAVCLSTWRDGKRKIDTQLIHRLVALTYIGKPPNDLYEVNHKDKNTKNNHFTNLEWVTREENTKHAWMNGRKQPKWKKGRINLPTKLTISQIKEIYQLHSLGINPLQISVKMQLNNLIVYNVTKKKGCYSLPIKKLEKLMIKKTQG